MKKKSNIPTILGIVILVAGTFAGVFFLKMNQVFKIGASATATPKDVRISNIGENSANVTWTTEGQSVGFVNWGESQASINKVEKESEGNQKFFTHSVTLTGLNPAAGYFFKINSDGTSYDNNGVAWQFTTGPALSSNAASFPVSGSVINSTGTPEKRALVYLSSGGYVMSTLTSDTGNFVFQLAALRTPDLAAFVKIDPAKTLLEISVTAGLDGVSSAQIFPQSANPIPPLVLGQVHDFRSLAPSANGQSPNADLSLPGNATQESKFNVGASTGGKAPTSVILESLTEGETVTSTQPQFFGKGPSGEKITITVHSENPVTGTVSIPASGSWSWSPPAGLAPGAHSITINWVDTTGITRSLTRNFIVQAGELPSFESSPSGATASPTATPKVGSTPTPTPKATATPKPTATASAMPVPITGDLTPTILLSIMGIAVLLFSFAIWKIAEN